MDDIKITRTIEAFEKFNHFSLDDFYSDKDRITEFETRDLDLCIARSVFKERIVSWLGSVDDVDIKDELLLLLSSYYYFPDKRYKNIFNLLISNLINEDKLDLSQTLFVTVPTKHNNRSGSDSVRDAIITAGRLSLTNDQIIIYSGSEDVCDGFENIVFIDDIISSGKTMHRLLDVFFSNNPQCKHKKTYIVCLCGREKHLKRLENEYKERGIDIKYRAYKNLEKCYDELHLSQNKKIMQDYEKRINSKEALFDGDEEGDCTLGYEKNQLLVSFYYNTPNNTLSSFWRETRITPNPLFKRCRKTKNTLDSIKNRCEQKKSFAIAHLGENADEDRINHFNC